MLTIFKQTPNFLDLSVISYIIETDYGREMETFIQMTHLNIFYKLHLCSSIVNVILISKYILKHKRKNVWMTLNCSIPEISSNYLNPYFYSLVQFYFSDIFFTLVLLSW